MEEVKKTDSNTKTQLSLAAALFFSPLVQYILKTGTRNINEQEKEFIKGYIRFWYFTLFLGGITLISWFLHYFLLIDIFNILYTVSIFVLLALLLISVVSILSDISLMRSKNWGIHFHTIEGNKKDILLKYLPLYNIYLWYHNPSFEKPNRRIKESLILWILFVLFAIFGSTLWSTSVLLLIILRIASLMSDIDILSIQNKQRINKLFFKNPEELRWYVLGFFTYLGKSIIHFFVPSRSSTLSHEIQTYKNIYSQIVAIKNNSYLIVEYILWILFICTLFYFIIPDLTVRTYYAWFWLLILRYSIMGIQLKYLPHLPIAREITIFIKHTIGIFRFKSFIKKK